MGVMKRLALVVLVLVAACSDDGDTSGAPASTTTTTSTTAPAEAACFEFREVDRGASVTVYGVFDCDGSPLKLAGLDAAFPVGGTVTHAEGLRCTDGGLVVRAALSDDGETYQAVERTYVVEGDELVLEGESGSTITAEEAQPYYELDCPTPEP